MVENGKEYVLQWTGHAAHVTERFSGLLARQALVDVTLICQGQKLRVHKLVLASSSLYFEEMLEQDLGQEPIILLRDLDFEVLKAMVEFMYCGETTISHCHLQALLDAAQVFKVKELECIVESMMKSERNIDKLCPDTGDSSEISNFLDIKRNICKARPSGERCDEKAVSSNVEHTENLDNKSDRILENNSRLHYVDNEDSMYERTEIISGSSFVDPNLENSSDENSLDPSESCDSQSSKMCTSEDDEESMINQKIVSSTDEKIPESSNECGLNFCDEAKLRESISSEDSSNDRADSQDIAHSVGECSRVYTHKKRKFTENEEYPEENVRSIRKNCVKDEKTMRKEDRPKNSSNDDEKVEKCLKVYTHKRRKSLDDKKCPTTSKIRDFTEEPTSTSRIDLIDENSTNDTPVTLPTSLDMETSEYIWSLSSESIQYVVGCTINPPNSSLPDKETTTQSESPISDGDNVTTSQKRTRQMKELYSIDNGNQEIVETPVLRRSVRINQLENDDSLNNNNSSTSLRDVAKVRDKSSEIERDDYVANGMILTKSRRKASKDADCRVTDENIVTTSNTLRKNGNSRSLRSGSKLASRKSKTSRCNSSRDERTKSAKLVREKSEKNDSTDILVSSRLNTIASVDRALWGDMSDVLENRENSPTEFTDYSPSREIPFAVGLLPLRAALERMQATLDHQPRKTRSSVAPFRQEINGHRRKFVANETENVATTRRQIGQDNDIVERAVCHIEIRTSSQCEGAHNRRESTAERMIEVGSTSDNNEQ